MFKPNFEIIFRGYPVTTLYQMDIFPDLINPVWTEVNHHCFPPEGILIGHTFHLTPEKSFRLNLRVTEDGVEKPLKEDIPKILSDTVFFIPSYSRSVVFEDYPDITFEVSLSYQKRRFEASRVLTGFFGSPLTEKMEWVVPLAETRAPLDKRFSLISDRFQFEYLSLVTVPFSHDISSFCATRHGNIWKNYDQCPGQLKHDIRNSELGKILSLEEFSE